MGGTVAVASAPEARSAPEVSSGSTSSRLESTAPEPGEPGLVGVPGGGGGEVGDRLGPR